jgi:hypothetical protein
MEQHVDYKKIKEIDDLIAKIYNNDLIEIGYYGESDVYFFITFKNKPDQIIGLKNLHLFTWNIIKSKIEKLIKSDVVCVVCFEKSIDKATIFCPKCCEFQCHSCFMSQTGSLCPVCRSDRNDM